MKKLLYITNGIKDPAGLERVLSIKASYLADELDYEVHILVLNNLGAKPFYHFSDKIILHDVLVSGNPFTYIKKYITGIKNVISSVHPDIILVCDDGLKAFFLPLLFGNKQPIVYERHVSKLVEVGIRPSFKKKLMTKLKFATMNVLARKFDKFIVLTNDNLKEWPLTNTKVISNPLSFYPYESSQLNNKRVIAVGKQSYQKGYDLLLNSWSLLQKEYPDWTLEIYGKFDPNQGLEELQRRLKLEDSVHFYPPVVDVENKYLESSIFVLSSRFEGFGMVLIEAMACGVPCVTFDCPYGPSDIVSNGVDGFVVSNGNVIEMSEALKKLMANHELRIAMGNEAKQNVKRFMPEVIVKQWTELFDELLNKN